MSDDKSFFDTLRGSLLTSIPALSVLTFIVVAVKVFRVAGEETSTTVAIVSQADDLELLKDVILTLLPGFLAAGVAATVSWWAGDIPEQWDKPAARKALTASSTGVCWVLVVLAMVTISWPFFIALAAPFVSANGWLLGVAIGRMGSPSKHVAVLRGLRILAGATAGALLVYLAVSSAVWLPQRAVTVADQQPPVMVKGKAQPNTFTAYVLHNDKDGTSLLMSSPRAVVDLAPGQIEPRPPICVPKSSSTRWVFLRLPQVLHIEKDHGSPYVTCPT
jgi:hypothetical protein